MEIIKLEEKVLELRKENLALKSQQGGDGIKEKSENKMLDISMQRAIEGKELKIVELTTKIHELTEKNQSIEKKFNAMKHKFEQLIALKTSETDVLRAELEKKANELQAIHQTSIKSNIITSSQIGNEVLENHLCRMEKCSWQMSPLKQNILVYCFGCELRFFTQCFKFEISPTQLKYFFKNAHVQFICFGCFHKLRGINETESQNSSPVPHKKCKMNADSNEIIEPESINFISILNNNCMEHIFEYLKWVDLLHIADTSKQFYAAVGNVFKQKYKNTIFWFNNGSR